MMEDWELMERMDTEAMEVCSSDSDVEGDFDFDFFIL